MNIQDIKTVGVIGAGTMGSGIAQVFAQAGYKVILFDVHAGTLEKGMNAIATNLNGAVERGKMTEEEKVASIDRISSVQELEGVKAEFIIEAVLERLELKQDIFGRLATINGSETILATNTSSIPITQIAAGVPNPERVVGVHFFNPAHIMNLVEVIAGAMTSPAVQELCYGLIQKIGKAPVMAKDAPGFIVNRVARHYYVEALKLLEEQVAPLETIDALMENLGFKMGPFRLMDLIGVDTNFSVTSSMYAQFHQDGKFRPSRIQQQKVDAGQHGRKTKQGFYSYN